MTKKTSLICLVFLFLIGLPIVSGAWWQNSANERYLLQFHAKEALDVSDFYTLRLTLNTSTWECNDDGDVNRIIVVRQDTNTVLNRKIWGNCGDTNLKLHFRFPFTITANSDYNSSDSTGIAIYVNQTPLTPSEDLNYIYYDASNASITHYWRFDENAGTTVSDTKGGVTMTWSGTENWEPQGNCYFGDSCISNDGSQADFLTFGNVGALSTGTIEVYYYPQETGVDRRWLMALDDAGSQKMNIVHNYSGNGNADIDFGGWASSTNAVSVNEWTHLAFTWDGINKKIYINGDLNNTVASATTLGATSTNDLMIGNDEASNKWHGRIDEILVWNTARTQYNFLGNPPDVFAEKSTKGGTLKINFSDENTGNALQPFFRINDQNFDANVAADGSVDLNIETWQTGNYVFKAWDLSHSLREWNYWLNPFEGYVYEFKLLRDTYGNDINFQMYYPDESTILADANIEVTIINSTNKASKKSTASDGTVSFFLNPNDAGYTFDINAPNGQNYSYTVTNVSALLPKNERTLNTVQEFSLRVGGLGAQNYQNRSSTVSFPILSNTSSFYTVNIDVNADFLPRTYYLKTKGNTSTYTLQPFVVAVSDAVSSQITLINELNLQPVPNLLLVAAKNISGYGETTVEAIKTDSTGTATFAFVANDSYSIYVYNLSGILQGYLDLIPVLSSYTFSYNAGSLGGTTANNKIDFNFSPSNSLILVGADQNFSLTQVIAANNPVISDINILITQGNNQIFNQNYASGYASGGTFSQDINESQITHSALLIVTVTVVSSDGVFSEKKAYSVLLSGTSNPLNALNSLKDAIGNASIFVAFIVALGVASLVSVKFESNVFSSSTVILTGAVLAFFVWIQWLPLELFGLSVLAGFAAILIRGRF